jgi:hypothetical protein
VLQLSSLPNTHTQAPGARQLQEARALEQRIRALLEQRLCKKKLAFDAAADVAADGDAEEGGMDATEEMPALIEAVFAHVQGPQAALRPPALSVLLCLVRAAANHLATHPTTTITTTTTTSSSSGGWVQALTERLQGALRTFAAKKNSRLAPKIWCVVVAPPPTILLPVFALNHTHPPISVVPPYHPYSRRPHNREEIVSRFPDLAVQALLPGLLAAVGGDAKAAFLRAECCR